MGRDRLRWSYRRHAIDSDRPAAWRGRVQIILTKLAAFGPPPSGLPHSATGEGAHLIRVTRGPGPNSKRRRIKPEEIARAESGRLPRQARRSRQTKAQKAAAASAQDTGAFLTLHGRDIAPLLMAAQTTADADALARSYRAVIEGEPGAAEAWVRLLAAQRDR